MKSQLDQNLIGAKRRIFANDSMATIVLGSMSIGPYLAETYVRPFLCVSEMSHLKLVSEDLQKN